MVNVEVWLIMFFAAKHGEVLCNQQKQDLELSVAQIICPLFQNSSIFLKKVGGTTRPFRYDLILISSIYIVEVMNRCKGLILETEYLKNYGKKFVNLYRKQWPKLSQRKRNITRQSGSEEILQIANREDK